MKGLLQIISSRGHGCGFFHAYEHHLAIMQRGKAFIAGRDRHTISNPCRPLMQGYLEKQTSGLFRKFQSRYFLQQRSHLHYYPRREDIADSSFSKHIDLSQCIAVGITDGDESAREFWIELPERTYWFRAPNKADRDCWIANLFVFNGASAQNPYHIAHHVFTALMDILKNLTSEVGDVEGLFRVPGDKQIIDRASNIIYHCNATEALSASDISAFELGSLFKKLLRELPETLLTQELYDAFTSSLATADSIRNLVDKIPMQNRDLLMKLAVLLHRQIKKTSVTKASIKSLSVLFAPCLSVSSEDPFVDISRLITILVDQGSTVFGYSFSRAVAQQVNLSVTLTGARTQKNQWVNQKLEKEVIPAKPAESHFSEVEPIDDFSIEVERLAPSPAQHQSEPSLSSRGHDDLATASKSQRSREPSPATSYKASIPILTQNQFQAHEFGLSSDSELTPRDGHRSGNDRNVSCTDAVRELSSSSYRPQTPTTVKRKGAQAAEPAQRKHILSMGISHNSTEESSHSTNTSILMKRLSLPQGRSRIVQRNLSNNSEVKIISDASDSHQNSASQAAGAATTSSLSHDMKTAQFKDITSDNDKVQGSSPMLNCTKSIQAPISAQTIPGEGGDEQTTKGISKDEKSIEKRSEDANLLGAVCKIVDSDSGAEQRINSTRRSTRIRSISEDKELESGEPAPTPNRRDLKDLVQAKDDLSFPVVLSDPEKSGNSVIDGTTAHPSATKKTIIPEAKLFAKFQNTHVPIVNIEPPDRMPNLIVKDYPENSLNKDLQSSPGRHYKITSSSQTVHVITKDFCCQTRKAKFDPEMKEMLEAAQGQILDCKERICHYQKRCKELEQAMESQSQASSLLQAHNISLQAKNRDLFKEQDDLNSDLEEALLQLEQARQQIKMQSTINANLTTALSQQKLQHEAIITSLENKNQAVIAESANLVVASQMSSKVQELSETCENVNIMLKKRLDMMRSRVKLRLHNSRENLASIESRAIMGLTESKQRIQRIQTELHGL